MADSGFSSHSKPPRRKANKVLRNNPNASQKTTDGKNEARAGQELRESEAKFLHAQQMAHVGHWGRDLISGKVGSSDELYRIFGLQPQEFEIDLASFLERVYPADRPSVEKAIRDSIDGVTPYDLAFRIVRPDGAIRWRGPSCKRKNELYQCRNRLVL